MSKATRNFLIGVGVIISLLLLALRVYAGLYMLPGDLRIFSGALGYDGEKSYAVLLLDAEREPLLFVFTLSEGTATFTHVAVAGDVVLDIPQSNLRDVSELLLTRLPSRDTIDAIAYITSDAARILIDAFGGLSMNGQVLSSETLDLLWETAPREQAVADYNTGISFSKMKLMRNSASLLTAIREVFSNRLVAVYFRDPAMYGKSCFGACDTQLFEYLEDSGSLKR